MSLCRLNDSCLLRRIIPSLDAFCAQTESADRDARATITRKRFIRRNVPRARLTDADSCRNQAISTVGGYEGLMTKCARVLHEPDLKNYVRSHYGLRCLG